MRSSRSSSPAAARISCSSRGAPRNSHSCTTHWSPSTPQIVVDVIAEDLAVPGSGAELETKIRELGRTIDVLVNNAGVGLHSKFVDQAA